MMNPRGSRSSGLCSAAHSASRDAAAATAPASAPAAPAPHRAAGRSPAPPRAGLHRGEPMRTRRPRVLAAALDRVLAHHVAVEEKVLLHPRRDVENRAVARHRVVDRLPEVPLLRRDRDTRGRSSAAGDRSTSGMRIGVGLPIISVRIAIMLWNAAVFRMPPFHQPSYGPPDASSRPACPRRRAACAARCRSARCRGRPADPRCS